MRRENSENNSSPPLLGDAVERALSLVGVTKERVERAMGRPCRCSERRRYLNDLHHALNGWAARVLRGKTEDAGKFLDGILGDGE